MKLSTLYRRAAEEMALFSPGPGFGMCWAIVKAVRALRQRMGLAHRAIWHLDHYHCTDSRACGPYKVMWGNNFGTSGALEFPVDEPAARQGRVLFLLFVSEQLKAEGR